MTESTPPAVPVASEVVTQSPTASPPGTRTDLSHHTGVPEDGPLKLLFPGHQLGSPGFTVASNCGRKPPAPLSPACWPRKAC